MESRRSKIEIQEWPSWVEPLLLALILIVAATFRFYDLHKLPPGLWFDEALNGLNALSILHDHPLRVYFDNREYFDGEIQNAQEPMFHYLLALSIALLGPTVFAIRVVSAAVGTLTVAVFYGMVRTMWGRRLALMSSFILSVFRWHFHFSREGFRTILVPLFVCLFIGLWWYALENRKNRYLILSGVFLGLGFYTYPAFQLIVPAWACWVVLLIMREKHRRRELLRAVLVPSAVALALSLPLIGYYATHPKVVSGRVNSLSIFHQFRKSSWHLLGVNAWDNFHQFWWRGDYVARHNVPQPDRSFPGQRRYGLAVFDPLTSVIFGIGLIITVIRVRREPGNILLLLWMISLSCASVFSIGAPNLLRTLGMVPAIAIVLTNGYIRVFREAEKRFSRKAASFLLAFFVIWFAGNEYYRYFVLWRNHSEVPQAFNSTYCDLANSVKRWATNEDVYIIPDVYHHPSIRYLLYGEKNIYELKIPSSLLRVNNETRDRILVYWKWSLRDQGGTDLLSRWFPESQLMWSSKDGFLRALFVPAGNLKKSPESLGISP